jgi:hypothetical protein
MSKSATSATPASKKASVAKAPTHDEIALRAYHIFLRRKGAGGDPHGDWLLAEKELLTEKTKKPKVKRKSNVTPIAA